MEKQIEETGDYRQRLTDHIIQQLEAGTAPWLKPWQPSKDSAQLPFNPVTNKSYRGANSILLSVMGTEKGYEDPRWCTYKQALEQGWQVRKGQKGTPIEYWKFSETQQAQDESGKPLIDKEGKPVLVEVKLEKPQVFRAFVFNAGQMDGVPELAIETKRTFAWVPEERAEAILNSSGAIILHDQHDRAFYSPTKDEIHLPPRGAFSSASGYYATALHELGHWSGHESRLNRTFGANFGSPDYAKEELRAELASYFLADRLGLPHDPSHHAAYVKNWIVVLKDDKNEIFRASRDAEKITEFVMSLDRTKELDRTSEHSPTNEREHPRKRTILAVPFAEKDQAKILGARWDKEKKVWFAPEGIDTAPLAKWIAVPGGASVKQTTQSPHLAFNQALRAAGLVLESEPMMDGRLHRVPVEGGRAGNRDGAYIGHLDGIPSGFIQNHRSGHKETWKLERNLSDEERAHLAAEGARAKLQRESERTEEYRLASERAARRWETLKTAPSKKNSYLDRKQVEAHGVKFDGVNLVIPVRDLQGRLWTLQTIPPEEGGIKRFERDGKKTGNIHVIGSLKNDHEILVAEGYSTAASLHEATGKTVIVAFDASNLDHVVGALKETFPNKAIFIMADNDKFNRNNVGVETALKSAEKHNVGVGFPEFAGPGRHTDYNDLHVTEGLSTVRAQVEHVLAKSYEQSRADAISLLQKHVGEHVLMTTPGENTRHSGVIIGESSYHAAQATGTRSGVLHEKSKLISTPNMGANVTIQYKNGQGISIEKTREKEHAHSQER